MITIISAILKLIGFIKWCRKEDNKIHIEQVKSKDKTLEESNNAEISFSIDEQSRQDVQANHQETDMNTERAFSFQELEEEIKAKCQ